MTKVFIDGSAGTTGLCIYDRLSGRRDIQLLTLDQEHRKDTERRREMINLSDITFLCLPDGAAIEAAELCGNENTAIIDASTAHRTSPGWSYGFPELSDMHREDIKTSKRVSVPGCHASGFLSIVYPLIKSGILKPDYPVVAHSVTGYSGGGKKMIAKYEDKDRSERLGAPAQYAIDADHKHLKEMQAVCKLEHKPLFNPIVADFYSGMVVSVPLYTSHIGGIGKKELFVFFDEYYKSEPLIRVVSHDKETHGDFIYADELSGKDYMQILIGGNRDRVLIASRFDNLGKGASGAAVQCMNIMLGIDEKTGLVL